MKCCIDAIAILTLLLCGVSRAAKQNAVPDMPMPIAFEDTIRHRWLSKPVLAGRLLDDMEDISKWSHHGFGQMSLTGERSKDGRQSLRLTSPTVGEKPGSVAGRPFGAATVVRGFDGEDWTIEKKEGLTVKKKKEAKIIKVIRDLSVKPDTTAEITEEEPSEPSQEKFREMKEEGVPITGLKGLEQKLQTLKKWKENGLISEEEYKKEKDRILEQLQQL